VTGSDGGTLLAFALSLSPDPQQQTSEEIEVEVEYVDSKGRTHKFKVRYKSVKTPPMGNLTVYGARADAETGKVEPHNVSGSIWREGVPNAEKYKFATQQGQGTVQLPPAPDYTAEATERDPYPTVCQTPIRLPDRFAIGANTSTSIRFLFIVHKGISGMVWERKSDGSLVPLPGATVEVFKGDQRIYSTQSESTKGIVGSFMIPGHIVDGWLDKYGDSSFTVKVTPPDRSMMQPNPRFIPRDTPTITKCRRRKTNEPCPRDTTINLGDFIFTYQPPKQPPGGG
jgi:hypothetical protein